ncbi:Lysophospholipase L1 [Singulisphaera sp. GP187]|uniref:SGNH/GDSL hydrolase family protein n=1 Tax=Singulisphaera sp. GP187 TaxID=1882752 RepID=UPI000928BF14|nr:SGNH/GDSL hydrolase family protein [Singulisphaera sp. GP187]SIO22607.1 Lysophospholipase L1 [Singulisphaera sp. GP187]
MMMMMMKSCFRYRAISIFLLLCISVSVAIGAEATKLDPARAKSEPGSATLWYDIRDLGVEGQGWEETKSPFDRLPAKAEAVVRKPVWDLSRDSAGLCVRFVTDAPTIEARWTLNKALLAMPHMPATGVSGLDLYARADDGKWRWLAVGQPKVSPTNAVKLVTGLPNGPREFLLYLPLYNGVSSVELGISKDHQIARAEPRTVELRKPILFYGTSITQGGCASRPGMVHTAILGRQLNRPVINLGFSGNGKMEPELADLLAELDPAVYVLDCLPNMSSKDVEERVEPFVHKLRKAHPDTPIVLAEDRNYTSGFILTSPREHNERNHAALRIAYEHLVAAGVKGLHYLPADLQIGSDGEGTVDGSHPTDLGFMRMAETFGAVLGPILGK